MWPQASVFSHVGLALLALLRFSHGGMLPVDYTVSQPIPHAHNVTWAEDFLSLFRRQAPAASWQSVPAASAPNGYGCPNYDGQEIVGASGQYVYQLYCNTDTNAPGLGQPGPNLAACMNWVESQPQYGDAVVFSISTQYCYSKQPGVDYVTNTNTDTVYVERRRVAPGATPTTASSCQTTPTAIAVNFRLAVVTVFGEAMFVTGGIAELGTWEPYRGLALNSSVYTDADPIWVGTVILAAGTSFEYKYVKSSNGAQIWEDDPNRSYTVVANCAGAVTISENFNRLAPTTTTSQAAPTTVTSTVTSTSTVYFTTTQTFPLTVTSTSTLTNAVSTTQTVSATQTTTRADSTVDATSTQVVATTVTVVQTIVVTATSTTSPVTTTVVPTTVLTTSISTTTIQNTEVQTATTSVNPTRTVTPTYNYQETSTVRSW